MADGRRVHPLARLALTVVVGCVIAFLLLQVVPAAFVLKLLGMWFVACLLVDDVPRAWRAIRRR